MNAYASPSNNNSKQQQKEKRNIHDSPPTCADSFNIFIKIARNQRSKHNCIWIEEASFVFIEFPFQFIFLLLLLSRNAWCMQRGKAHPYQAYILIFQMEYDLI